MRTSALLFLLASDAGLKTQASDTSADPAGFSSTGNFFYAQVFYRNEYTSHYSLDVGIGCDFDALDVITQMYDPGDFPKYTQRWIISTQEESAGFVTSICTDDLGCKVPHKFFWAAGAPNPSDPCLNNPTEGQQTHETAHLNDGIEETFSDPIPEYFLQGQSLDSKLTLMNAKYGREIPVETRSFAIMQSAQQIFESGQYSGYLGLAPYTFDLNLKKENILYSLKNHNRIDHSIVSLYLQANGVSMIKFGGYDKLAIKDQAALDVFPTVDLNSWKMHAQNPKVNGELFVTSAGFNLEFSIDPQLPMIYIPSNDYSNFVTEVKKFLGNKVDCDQTDRPCLISSACKDVPADTEINFTIELKKSAQSTKVITIPKESLLVSGSIVGEEDKCFIGVYKLPYASSIQDIYYFGLPFFNSYYVSLSLDAYEADTDNVNNLLVGVGEINPDACLGDQVFNKNYTSYNEALAPKDISKAVSGHTIAYSDNNCIYQPTSTPEQKALAKNYLYIAIGVTGGGIVIIITFIVLCCYFRKRSALKEKETPDGEFDKDGKLKDNFGEQLFNQYYGIQNRDDSVSNAGSVSHAGSVSVAGGSVNLA